MQDAFVHVHVHVHVMPDTGSGFRGERVGIGTGIVIVVVVVIGIDGLAPVSCLLTPDSLTRDCVARLTSHLFKILCMRSA
jgi:hypothetical protein